VLETVAGGVRRVTIDKAKWLVLGLLGVALWLVQAPGDGERWEGLRDEGAEAYLRGDYAEAEVKSAAALELAETFESDDPRLATSLGNLATLYQAQGRYAEAGPLHERALAIREAALGPEHPDVAKVAWRYGRWHHYVNFKVFEQNKLILRDDRVITPGVDNYGMVLKPRKSKVIQKQPTG